MDVFRYVPFRYGGYAFVMGEMLYIRAVEDGPPDMMAITIFYMAGHTVYLTALAAVEILQPYLHGVSLVQRVGYVTMTFVETVTWDCLASVILPYTVGATVFWILDSGLCGDMREQNPVRRWLPVAAAIAFIPLCGPFLDLSVDFFLESLLGTHRYLWNI
ncbi:uncharacterized protein LOC101853442 [Aplysia californica]|uniref:Uncharacterized protein LOC101853442 n=1 Tax=Aplysia californica TaxID=6500 RepID=A0ABM0ZU81_APLCA|nr:uncharacterized protein LOC101853442 [Aplysia californica]